ncbi:hypothetical protein QBC47DRAFT_208733 [Echria macrotheca]|uniref:DUF7707 domain-containing protein n=1 Tax=Echria macrotheca TaxID=438768 RepID=A0AAJ0FB90_9PEZI|nr:hypothetical protein QBC47DRAFT_208733 [Echria macrotheca]
MVSFRTTLLALAGAVAVSADYVIDPDSVPILTRKAWCNDELSNCPIICQQSAPGPVLSNSCDPETLTYGCVCSDGLQPNMSEYSLTMPFYICQKWGDNCVAGCGMNNECSSSCRQDHPCGAQSPKRVNTTSSSTAAPTATDASATGPQIFTGLAGQTSTSKPAGSAAPALQFGSAYGLGVVVAGLFAGCAMIL